MSSSKRTKNQASAFLLAEEAVQLLFRGGLHHASIYCIGSIPFVLALVAYVGTMIHSGYAHVYHGTGALGLALLFMWMKALQARFGQHLAATLRDESLPPWTLRAFMNTFCRQALLHATFIVVYPISFLTVIPLGFAASMYQNMSVLDDCDTRSTRKLAEEALAQARLWPKQNHLLLWLCSPLMICLGAGIAIGTMPILNSVEDEFVVSLGGVYAFILLAAAVPTAPFSVFTVANVGVSIYFILEMAHVVTGADTLFARNPGALLENDLFISLVCGITYLLLDPVLKAAYAIRCHEGTSLHTGADLRVALRQIKKTAAVLLVLASATLALPAVADAPVADAPGIEAQLTSLDQAINEELSERRYTWRMPREERPDVELPWLMQILQDFGNSIRGWIKAGFDFASDVIEAIWDWFFGDGSRDGNGWDGDDLAGSSRTFSQSFRILTGLLAMVLIVATLYLIWRAYRRREPTSTTLLAAAPTATPDLRDEATTAADLPQDEWTQMARELAGKGEYRLASRALFFSILATLAQQEIIRIARFKSNMDYDVELLRRAASIGNIPQVFSRSALLYETVWYGEHEATLETLEALNACQKELHHGLS